ncbi:MAG: metalloregulator ArsR/SmtB family transcription factor [candidate division KSB1 bacterium]|nr:metalloregulator ArsR/SmtB family transcription factor [candidate division KSB1 bacterium]
MQKAKIEICSNSVVDYKKINRVSHQLPEREDLQELSETFKVLSDPTRLKIVLALAQEELCVCDLAALVDVSISAISHQLRLLRNMRLVSYRKEGKMVYYRLDDEHVENLIREASRHVEEG